MSLFSLPQDLFTDIVFVCKSSVWLVLLKTELLSLLSKDFITIIRNHVGWLLTGNRKQKNMSNFWPN